MSTIETLKIQAKRLRAHLSSHNMPVTHSQSLEAVAAMLGHRNWNTAVASLARPPVIQTPLLLEVTRDSTPEHLHASLQALLRLAPDAIHFKLAADVSLELEQLALALATQIEQVGFAVTLERRAKPDLIPKRSPKAGRNSFVDGVYEALVGMGIEFESEGTTPIAVLKKMDVLVTALNIQKVTSAVEKLIGINAIPGLRISEDSRVRVDRTT